MITDYLIRVKRIPARTTGILRRKTTPARTEYWSLWVPTKRYNNTNELIQIIDAAQNSLKELGIEIIQHKKDFVLRKIIDGVIHVYCKNSEDEARVFKKLTEVNISHCVMSCKRIGFVSKSILYRNEKEKLWEKISSYEDTSTKPNDKTLLEVTEYLNSLGIKLYSSPIRDGNFSYGCQDITREILVDYIAQAEKIRNKENQ